MERSEHRASPATVLVLTLVFVGLFALFTSLGRWQLARASEKEQLASEFAEGATGPAREALPASIDADRYAMVAVAGRYDAAHQVLLDAMTHDGIAGYEVLTPFEPVGSSRWLLVNRGWVPAALDRSSLPVVPVDEERRRVLGRIADLPAPGLRLGSHEPIRAQGLELRLFPTIEELEQSLGRPLFPYQLWLAPDAADGYVREWRLGGLPAEQHLAYAVQWFALAALVAVLGAWLGYRSRRSVHGHRRGAT